MSARAQRFLAHHLTIQRVNYRAIGALTSPLARSRTVLGQSFHSTSPSFLSSAVPPTESDASESTPATLDPSESSAATQDLSEPSPAVVSITEGIELSGSPNFPQGTGFGVHRGVKGMRGRDAGVAGTTFPLNGMLAPKTKRDQKFRPIDLMKYNSFLGFGMKSTHPAMYANLLGDVSGHAIIDPEATFTSLRRALRVLQKVSFAGGRILFISTQPALVRLNRVIGQQSGQFYLGKRWIPGLLTNWERGRNHVLNKLKLDPRLANAGKLRLVDFQKAGYFKGVEEMATPPDLIFNLDDTNLQGEPSKMGIPVIGIVDSNSDLKGVDYAIPANTKSLKFYHTLAHLVIRAIKEGEELREELAAYEKPKPEERGGRDTPGGDGGTGYRGRGGDSRNTFEGSPLRRKGGE